MSVKRIYVKHQVEFLLFSITSEVFPITRSQNRAKLISIIILLLNSVFKDPFHHFHSMFQQFNSSSSVTSTLHWIPFPLVNC